MNNLLNMFARLEELEIILEVVDNKLKIDAPKGSLTPDLLNELKENKQDIIEFLREKVETQGKYISIEPVREKDFYVMSSAQKRVYFLQQLDPKSTVYNITQAIELEGDPDIKKLETTFKKLIKRHESLRTSFKIIEYKPVQKIYDDVEFRVRNYEDGDDAEQSAGNAFEDLSHPFDLSLAPLFRVALISGKNKKNTLVVIMHHIICDGVSHQVLRKDFISLYNGNELPPLRLQYKDYAEWQNRRTNTGRIKKQEEYWLNEFGEEVQLIDLPSDYPRPALQNFEGAAYPFNILKNETLALKEMGLERGASLYMVLLSILNILLSKLCRQEDIIIGTPAAGRRHADLEKIIGMFVNTLPLRNYPQPHKTFDTLLKEVRARTLEAFENQDYQFEDLVEKVVKDRDESRNPLFDVMFSFQNIGDINMDMPEPVEVHDNSSNLIHRPKKAMFDMTWVGMETGQGISFQVDYAVKLFKKVTIGHFIEYFKKILSSVIENPGITISEIDIAAEEKKKQILYEFNNTNIDYPKHILIHEMFEDQVKKNPDYIAIAGPLLSPGTKPPGSLDDINFSPLRNGQLTYRQLNEKSNQLAHQLQKYGVPLPTIISIQVERSIEMIIGIIGIIKAGAAYLPIDPDSPEDRINYMLTDSASKILLTTLNHSNEYKFEIGIIYISDAINCVSAPSQLHLLPAPVTSLAYTIYTSGSTGKPKGVLVEHSSVVNLAYSQKHQFEIDETDRVLLFSPICFDASVEQIFIALFSGAVLVVVDKGTLLDNSKFEEFITAQAITHLNTVPLFLSNIQLKERYQLKRVIVGGDICPPALARKWGAYWDFYNQYGPTETTVTSLRMLSKNHDEALARLPIGKPINNTFAYLLDRWMKLVPPAVVGELYIGGQGVCRGYLNRPELTAEKFVRAVINHSSLVIHSSKKLHKPANDHSLHYLNTPSPHPPIYRTGDLGRWLADGNIEFIGRIDNQVKIRGFRIELGEIEKNLQEHDEIKEAIVVAKENNQNNKSLCTYFTADKKIEISHLKNFLTRLLPQYMIPSYFIQLDSMPLTPTGKIDLKALPDPKTGLEFVTNAQPQSEFEKKLLKIWAETLEINKEQINSNSNFFELGGNSLNLLLLITKIENEFEIKLSVTQIYNQPVFGEVLKLLFTKSFEDNPVVLLGELSTKKIFCFPPQIGYGIFYMPLARIIKDYSFYGLSFIENVSHEERMQKYIDLITEIQPQGPYIFFGYSSAGKLSFQVTKALEQGGAQVSDIIFIDCYFAKETDELARMTREEKEKGLEIYNDFLDQLLEKFNLSNIKPKILKKSLPYMEYFENLFNLEPINANVHLIMSEGARNAKKIKPMNWEPLIKKKFTRYNGFGKHQTVFTGEFLNKNAEVMKKILDNIESRTHPEKNK